MKGQLLTLVAAWLMLSALPAQARPPAPQPSAPQVEPTKVPAARPLRSINTLPRRAKRPGTARLQGTLDELSETYVRRGSAGLEHAARQRDIALDGDRTPIVVEGDASQLPSALTKLGGQVDGVASDRVSLLAPVSALRDIAALEGVRYVRLPLPAIPAEMPEAGTVQSQGAALINADAWHAAGFKGQAVKAAVIDSGFYNYEALQTSGDLPESIECVNYTTRFNCGNNKENQKHGSACAELLYDMAPGIDMLYLYAFGDEVDIASIVDHMIFNGVGVASMSWGWLNGEPYDGSGFVSAQVNRARENGIFWAVSAGNQRERHHEAYFDPGDCSEGHDFDQSDDCANLNSLGWQAADDKVCIWLEWNDWPETDQDYDLRIFRDNGGEPLNLPDLDFLQEQDGDDPPTEGGCFRAPTADIYYFLIDQHNATSNHYFEVFSWHDDFGQAVQESSILEPATADGAVSTAAFPATDITALEDFSSMGPRNPAGGGPYDPSACSQEPAPECKPDFAGPDRVSTASYDPSQYVFFGTSAAAPHVAGAAALVKGAHFPWGPAEIYDFLKNRALQPDGSTVSQHTMAASTQQDPGWGWGRSWLGNPPAAIAVEVTHLGALPEGCTVRVEWQTGAEVGNLGFDIYRSNAASGGYIVLNEELVPSASSSAPLGAAYTWWDSNVEPGRTYWYKVQAVDARGQNTLYGPVEATALHCLALPLITSD